eukprot:6459154-Amphidinium_carterae.1
MEVSVEVSWNRTGALRDHIVSGDSSVTSSAVRVPAQPPVMCTLRKAHTAGAEGSVLQSSQVVGALVEVRCQGQLLLPCLFVSACLSDSQGHRSSQKPVCLLGKEHHKHIHLRCGCEGLGLALDFMLGKHQSKCHRFRPLILACGFAVTLLGPRTFLCPQITRAHLQRPQVLRHALSVDAILEDGQDAEAVSNVAQEANGGQEEGKHVLLVVLDDNPYLSGSTKAALKHAAIGAKAGNKVTAMVLPGTPDGNLTNPEVL